MPLIDNSLSTCSRIVIAIAILLYPWLHGAELPWEQVSMAGFIFVALLLAITQRNLLVDLPAASKTFFMLFILWLAYCCLYIIPLPFAVVEVLSPNIAAWYNSGQPPEEIYLSVYKQASLIELFKYIALAALFLLVTALFREEKNVHRLAWILVAGCLLTALYSLLNFGTKGQFEWVAAIPPWGFEWENGIRGTFSYKNQYAIYLAMTIAVATGLLADRLQAFHFSGHSSFTAKVKMVMQSSACILLISIVVLYITLLNTSSRGAVVSLIVAAIIALGLYLLTNRVFRKLIFNRKILGLGAVALIIAAALFTQSSIFKRFGSDKLEDNGRTLLRNTVVQVIEHSPVFGTGPGTYPYIQHYFKPLQLGNSQMSKRAHNDYLETFATQGIIGFSLLGLSIGYLLVHLFKNVDTRFNGLLLGCRCAIVAYMIQAVYDVNAAVYYLPFCFILILALGNVILLFHRRTSDALVADSNEKAAVPQAILKRSHS
ncbi:O-antigen ligase family protein [Alteromonas pelagimontana]|uniref:O-antigen ligase family protein n=1 Tax=Alteromonas pelagimontana TaxID=1858656 RepID=A0A6M4MAM5_9ALTE|nr:O-antigen ligase family protein [Alteromonas pelagimontana]QJR80224.1 O-antigen ligase family protein [Alteromonas pelagimontana]